MLELKQRPQDFLVKEIAARKLKARGRFGIFLMEKQNLTTFQAVQRVAQRCSLKPQKIGFAGNKDKRAITTQYISIPSMGKSFEFQTPKVKIKFRGYMDHPIRIGDLDGNEFRIIIKTDKEPSKRTAIPNYFDSQRFSDYNSDIGLAILKKDFRQVVKLIQKSDKSFEAASKVHLKQYPNDFINVLSIVPKALMLLYVHAFQSLLFNRLLDQYIRNKTQEFNEWKIGGCKLAFPKGNVSNISIPVPGFATTDPTVEPLLKQHKLSPGDFVIPQMKWLSQEGTTRQGFIKLRSLKITKQKAQTFELKFRLPPGSYATIAAKSLI